MFAFFLVMERQVILLEDLIDVFAEELGHVLEAVDQPGPGRPPVYPAEGMFLCWLFMYLGVADSQRRLVQLLAQHREWRERLGFQTNLPAAGSRTTEPSMSWKRFSAKLYVGLLRLV